MDVPDFARAKLMLAAASILLGEDHCATLAFARAVTTRKIADLADARLALRAVSKDQRHAIAAAIEAAWDAEAV